MIIAATSLLVIGVYETYPLDVTHSVLGKGKDSLKVLLLSDIHAAYFFVSPEKLGLVIEQQAPDAVFFAGDLSSGSKDFEKGIEIMKVIKSYADKFSTPVYAVEGNHDRAGLGERLKALGIRFLANESDTLVTSDGSRWLIAGLKDIRNSEPSYREAVRSEKIKNGDRVLPQVILAHNPECIFKVASELGEDHPDIFLLSGHFHGGQIWMPFGIEYLIMRNERMSREGYRKGPYERDSIKGYISRGLGCVIFPLRFLSKPEAAVIELKSDPHESL